MKRVSSWWSLDKTDGVRTLQIFDLYLAWLDVDLEIELNFGRTQTEKDPDLGGELVIMVTADLSR